MERANLQKCLFCFCVTAKYSARTLLHSDLRWRRSCWLNLWADTRTFWAITVCSQAEIVLKCCKYLPLNDRSAGVMRARRSKVFKVESLHNRDSNTASTRLCHIASHFSYFIWQRVLCFGLTLFLFFGQRKIHWNRTRNHTGDKQTWFFFFPCSKCVRRGSFTSKLSGSWIF